MSRKIIVLIASVLFITGIGTFSPSINANAYSTPPRGTLGQEPGTVLGAHDHSGLYRGGCPAGYTGGYIGGQNYWCHR